jgi:hypothetical protein
MSRQSSAAALGTIARVMRAAYTDDSLQSQFLGVCATRVKAYAAVLQNRFLGPMLRVQSP